MVGFSDENPKINTDEVANFKWIAIDKLKKDLNERPEDDTVWFAIIFDRFCKNIEEQ